MDLAASKTFRVVAGTLESIDDDNLSLDVASVQEILEAGTVIDGKYQILSVLGQGGMGAVYRAYHLTLNKDVALKTFYSKDVDEGNWQRFLLEAKLIAKLQDPNIIQVYDYGHGVGGRPYYTMELLEGESLAERISRKGRLSLSEAQAIFTAVANGLTTAHGHGIIHRDLKPGNIFILTGVDFSEKIIGVKIVDFGIAKITGTVGGDEQGLTSSGQVFGSPLYMSPEQAAGLLVDARTDIYSMGCALFEALTGQPPFKKANALATIMAHVNETPPTLSQACPEVNFPEWLEIFISRLLAKRRESRIKSCAEIPHIFSYESKRRQPEFASEIASQATLNNASDEVANFKSNRPGLYTASIATAVIFCALAGYLIVLNMTKQAQDATKSFKASVNIHGTQVKSDANLTPAPSISAHIAPPRAVPESLIRALPAEFYLGREMRNNQSGRLFQFGRVSVGKFITGDGKKPIDCVNLIFVPDRPVPSFCPGAAFFENPQLFGRFGADSLWSIRFDPDLALDAFGQSADPSWGDKHIHAINHIKSLGSINFGKTDVTDAVVSDLNLLPNLRDIEMIHCHHFDVEQLLKLKRLAQVKNLVLATAENGPSFIDKAPLAHMQLEFLNLKETRVSGKEIALISQLKDLQCLSLDKTDLTDADIYPLAKLARLSYLSISGPRLTAAILAPLTKLKHLRELHLSGPGLKAHEPQFKRVLGPWCPKVDVSNSDKEIIGEEVFKD